MQHLLIALLLFATDRFPKCPDRFEPPLAMVKEGTSEHRLAEELTIECSDGRTYVLLARGTRLPASYEDNFFAPDEEAEEVQLFFQGLSLFASKKLHKGPGGLPHMKATIRVDESGQVTLTEWDPEEELVVPVGSLPVEKGSAQ